MVMTVRLFARAKDLVGAESVRIELPDGTTVGELRRALATGWPQLAPLVERSALAVDNEFAEDDRRLGSGDEIALLPPVSGGAAGESPWERLQPPILTYPANVPCPICGEVVQDWHTEWNDPTHAPDFSKGLRALDCPLCGGWVLYKDRQIQAVPGGASPQRTRRQPLQAARWAKSQSRQGNLRDYLDQSAPGQQYRDYFTDQDVLGADTDAQADPRY